jgi:transposase
LAADLRRFFSRHAKSNTINAHTLARLPLVDPGGLAPVALPDTAARARLDRHVRAAARLTREIGERKTRIIELARQAMPEIGTVLSQKLARADLAVLEHYGDPRTLAKAGDALVTLVAGASAGRGDPHGKVDAFRAAARSALALYGDSPAVAFDVLADEIATEIRLLRAAETERDRHGDAREQAYILVDPDQLARSLPGLGTIGAPMLVSVLGDPDRFARGSQVKSFTGLTPRASETGETSPLGPAHLQGRQPRPTHPADPLRGHRPPTRPGGSCSTRFQGRLHADLGVAEEPRDRAEGAGLVDGSLELLLVGARDRGAHGDPRGGDCRLAVDLVEGHRRGHRCLVRGDVLLTEHQVQRHREARGVRGRQQFLGAGLAAGLLGPRRPRHLQGFIRPTVRGDPARAPGEVALPIGTGGSVSNRHVGSLDRMGLTCKPLVTL